MATCCKIQVERGIDAQAGLVHLFGAEVLFELAAHLFLEPGRHRAHGLRNVQAERSGARLLGLGVGDHAVRLHLAEHQVAAADGAVGIEHRRKRHRPLGQPGQQRRFSQVQIFGVLGKEILRGGLEAVHPAAQVNLVAVEGEDLLLGEGALNLDGEVGLLHLAHDGAVGGEKEIARQLHGERGSALRAAVRADVVPGGAGDAEDIDAPVRLEVLVFNGDDGLAQDGRKAVVADHLAALQREGADDAALAVVEIGGGGGAVMLKFLNLRQIDGVDEGETGQRAGNGGQHQQGRDGGASGQLAAAVLGERRTGGAARPGQRARFKLAYRGPIGGRSQGGSGLTGSLRKCGREAAQ